jgi:hypothetical protein
MHANRLTGTVPALPQSTSIQFINLASNFLVGGVPTVLPHVTADFRFNYFDDCSDLCCLLNEECVPQCLNISANITLPASLPLGVDKSVWTELNVTLLGESKRIIQIETHFSSPPHILKSYACPNLTDSLYLCDIPRVNVTVNNSVEMIPLEKDVSVNNFQDTNTYSYYVYYPQADVCSANVKVMKIH